MGRTDSVGDPCGIATRDYGAGVLVGGAEVKLTDLEPQFVRYETKDEVRDFIVGDPATWHERGNPVEYRVRLCESKVYVNTLAEAQGIMFLCPVCFAANGGNVGTHSCEVTFEGRGALPSQGTQNKQGPVRWNVSGDSYENLTTTPSIQLIGGCNWHGYITNGDVT
ncbi:MAG TPA: DUF6527 family protein [Nitrospira sp.]|nr:DUF6527 family protein [Nitrospira sp.]